MDKTWTDADAKLLKQLRTATGQDRANFARRCTISIGQLTELEEGGSGRFYSDRIKAHTGQTLLEKLGHVREASPAQPAAAPAAPVVPAPAAPAPAAPVAPVTDRMDQPSASADADAEAQDVQPRAPSAAAPSGTPARSSWRTPALVAVVAVGAMLVWVNSRRPTTPPGVVAEPVPVPAQVSASAPEPAQAAQAPAASTASAAAAPAASAASAVQAASRPAAPKASAPASAASVAPASEPAASQQASKAAAQSCDPLTPGQVAQFTPSQASRPSNYVHVEAAREVTVCVTDSQKRQHRVAVRPGPSGGVTISGDPPFTLQAKSWGEVRVFFQGVRVPVEAYASTQAVVLAPRAN